MFRRLSLGITACHLHWVWRMWYNHINSFIVYFSCWSALQMKRQQFSLLLFCLFFLAYILKLYFFFCCLISCRYFKLILNCRTYIKLTNFKFNFLKLPSLRSVQKIRYYYNYIFLYNLWFMILLPNVLVLLYFYPLLQFRHYISH